MKLKTRFVIVFISFVLMPVIIFGTLFAGFGHMRIRWIEKQYGIEFTAGYFFNSVQAIREATEELCEQMRHDAEKDPDMFPLP